MQDEFTNIEPLKNVKERQVVWPDWMEKATKNLGDNDLVKTVTKNCGPMGSFLLSIEAV